MTVDPATREVRVGPVRLGGGNPLVLMAGPCVIESESHLFEVGERLLRICGAAGIPLVLKASFDVVDMRGLGRMRRLGVPVIFDATHSVQLPGGAGSASAGQREYLGPLVRAAVAAGCDGLFLEVHPDPDRAPSDGASLLPLDALPALLAEVTAIARALAHPI